MAKNPESIDQAKTEGQSHTQDSSQLTGQRADSAHLSGPGRPNYLSQNTVARAANESHVAASAGSTAAQESVSASSKTVDSKTGNSNIADQEYSYLPPKLRQRMQALMAELSLEDEVVEAPKPVSSATQLPTTVAQSASAPSTEDQSTAISEDLEATQPEAKVVIEDILIGGSSESNAELDLIHDTSAEDVAEAVAEEAIAQQASSPEVTAQETITVENAAAENATDLDVIIPAPGDLVELPTNEATIVDSVVESEETPFDEIDAADLAKLGIKVVSIGSDSATTARIDFVEINDRVDAEDVFGLQDVSSEPTARVSLETERYLPEEIKQEWQQEEAAAMESTEASEQRQQDLVNTTESFSQQASEIVEILKQKQNQLSRVQEQLAIGKAKSENELRQQRLELVEKKRQFLAEVTQYRKSLQQRVTDQKGAAATTPQIDFAAPTAVENNDTTATSGRKVTLESIAMPKATTVATDQVGIDSLSEETSYLDPEFLRVLKQHLPLLAQDERASETAEHTTAPTRSEVAAPQADQSQIGQTKLAQPTVKQSNSDHDSQLEADQPSNVRNLSEARLQQQAASLKKQHSAAVGSLRKTRRQLELLRNVVIQQQQQTAERATDLDQQHEQWSATRNNQLQELEVDRRELDRLTSIRENELSKRETATIQREKAVRQLESKLQQAQVEILRDRMILRQLERTARQTLSNAQWSDRLAIITEETEGYLREMKSQAENMKAEASQQIKRLDSRQSELLLYRESLRNWVQRQMKLISRRSAHLEERESNLQQRWDAISEARTELQTHQESLNDIIRSGLNKIDDHLESPDESSINEAA